MGMSETGAAGMSLAALRNFKMKKPRPHSLVISVELCAPPGAVG